MIYESQGYRNSHFTLGIARCKAVIPPRKNRKESREYDKDIYKERHFIECFFGKIKYLDGSSLDLTKQQAYIGFLNVAAIFIWIT